MTDVTVTSRAGYSVVPLFNEGGNVSVQTNADGTTFTAFASRIAKRLVIANNTGTDIEFRQGGSGVSITIPNGTNFELYGFDNISNIQVRRADTSTTQVTVTARWEN